MSRMPSPKMVGAANTAVDETRNNVGCAIQKLAKSFGDEPSRIDHTRLQACIVLLAICEQ